VPHRFPLDKKAPHLLPGAFLCQGRQIFGVQSAFAHIIQKTADFGAQSARLGAKFFGRVKNRLRQVLVRQKVADTLAVAAVNGRLRLLKKFFFLGAMNYRVIVYIIMRYSHFCSLQTLFDQPV
tara:strand:+ start:2325 stop:2693 length:369 start_codon:yes stop_codon:yes gene_type:complete